MTRRTLSTVGAIATALFLALPVFAGQKRPVPDVQMLGRDGKTASLKAGLPAKPVVVIYVAPGSAPCERLLEAMRSWDPPVDPKRVVFVVDGRSEEAGPWLAQYLPPASDGVPAVYFDIDGKGRTALQVSAAPTLLGVTGGEIRWDLAGVLNDPAALEPVVRNWSRR